MGLLDDAKKALNSDKGEKASDSVLDKASRIASQKTGGKHDEQVTKAAEFIDRKIGK